MQKRKFVREFKVVLVRLVLDRGVSAAQAARDLDVHENVLRKSVTCDGHTFPGAWTDEAGTSRDRTVR